MLEEELTRVLNTQLAVFFGQMTKHIDERLVKHEVKFDEKLDKIQTTLDGIVERIDGDDQERGAMNQQLKRYDSWIGQLAQNTKTKLVPEQ